MQKTPYDIVVFLIATSVLIISMVAFIISIFYLYRKRQQHFLKSLEQIKLDNEKTILSAQLEMQEETFKHISREIHDNINLSLTLAKLNLHTVDFADKESFAKKIASSIELITQSIAELSDVSKSLNADIIIHQGLLKAIEEEVLRISQTGVFHINYTLSGNPVYMDAQKELVIFRIVQESFNNIIKHAAASSIKLNLDFAGTTLTITINDNGKGFDKNLAVSKQKAGIKNMETRTKMLNGRMDLTSIPEQGTMLSFKIPII